MARLGATLLLCLAGLALAWRAYGQDDFSLEDALDDIPTQKPKPGPKPPRGPSHDLDDFDLSDFFKTTKSPKVIPKRPTRKPDIFIPTKARGSTARPPKKPDSDDFSLEEALYPRNDPSRGGPDDFNLENVLDHTDNSNRGVNSDTESGKEPTSSSMPAIKQEMDPVQEVLIPDSGTDSEIQMILQTLSHEMKSMHQKLRKMETLLDQVTKFVETGLQSKKEV